jgi:periplasmic protein TonB
MIFWKSDFILYFTGMKNCLLLLTILSGSICCFAQPSPPKDSTRESYITFRATETEAAFPGGRPGWQQFLVQNIRFDKILPLVPKTGIRWEQTAVVQFIVEKDGSVSELKVVNEVSEAVAKEAIRIISNSPKWVPATQNGKKVRAYKKQPIMFVVEPS